MTAGRNASSTNAKDWCTPKSYVEIITAFFDGAIALDPCSNLFSITNAKTSFTENGLTISWNYGSVYCNPPYGRGIAEWVKKCANAYQEFEAEVIALVPVATNTKLWQNTIFKTASAICFLKEPRVKFFKQKDGDNLKGAPMACCLVYWGVLGIKFKEMFSSIGKVVIFDSP